MDAHKKSSALVTIAIFRAITSIDSITTLGRPACYISLPPACNVEIWVKRQLFWQAGNDFRMRVTTAWCGRVGITRIFIRDWEISKNEFTFMCNWVHFQVCVKFLTYTLRLKEICIVTPKSWVLLTFNLLISYHLVCFWAMISKKPRLNLFGWTSKRKACYNSWIFL